MEKKIKCKQMLTLRKRILSFVESSIRQRGFPPTEREIAKYFHFSSTRTAHYHLTFMKNNGLLKFRYKKGRRCARGLKLR